MMKAPIHKVDMLELIVADAVRANYGDRDRKRYASTYVAPQMSAAKIKRDVYTAMCQREYEHGQKRNRKT